MVNSGQYGCCLFGCNAAVPAELQAQRLCVSHFILTVEQVCAQMRRETAEGRASAERLAEIANYLTQSSVTLFHVAAGSLRLSGEEKRRVLNTFLTLMNLRESIDRTANRHLSELRIAS